MSHRTINALIEEEAEMQDTRKLRLMIMVMMGTVKR